MPRTESPPGRPVRHPGVPAAGALEQQFDLAGLGALRDAVTVYAHRLHVCRQQVTNLVMVAGELAVNAITHGGGSGRLVVWRDGPLLYCRVTDQGPGITDAAIGTAAPEITATHGRGIWMCRQVCRDLLIGRVGGGGASATAVLDLGRPESSGPGRRIADPGRSRWAAVRKAGRRHPAWLRRTFFPRVAGT